MAKLELFELNGSTEAVPSPVDPLKLLPNGSRESVWLKFFEPNGSELEVKGSTAAAGFDPNGSIERVFDPNGSILLFDEKDSLDLAAKMSPLADLLTKALPCPNGSLALAGAPKGSLLFGFVNGSDPKALPESEKGSGLPDENGSDVSRSNGSP